MATWIVHLRIADKLIKQGIIPDDYRSEFIIGSLAPDCGYGKKDSFGDFTPPPSVTHWAPDGCKIFCEYERFYNTYLQDTQYSSDYYFYLGYYVHLITDVLWSTSIYMPTRLKYADEYSKDPEFLNIIKKDWYALDFDFLLKTPDFEPYRLLQEVDSVKDYLSYYENNQLTKQIKFIADYYSEGLTDIQPHEYNYLHYSEMTEFINIASGLILSKIKERAA